MPGFSPDFSHSFFHCCLCIWNFHCLRHRNEFVNKIVMSQRIHPFCSDVIFDDVCVLLLSSLGLVLSSASTDTSVFCLAFPNIAVGLVHCSFIGFLQGIRTANFRRSVLILSLNSSTFGSIKNISFNCLALSSFELYDIPILALLSSFAASDICFHIPIWPYIIWT